MKNFCSKYFLAEMLEGNFNAVTTDRESAIIFGLLHTFSSETGLYNIIVQSLQYMVMGGVMAYAYSKTNNMFVNISIHAFQNTLGVLLMLFM